MDFNEIWYCYVGGSQFSQKQLVQNFVYNIKYWPRNKGRGVSERQN